MRKFKPVEKIDPVKMAKAVLIRREIEDPLLHYKPSPTQQAFHQRINRYALIAAPTRSGKTTCNAMDLAMCARRKHPTKTVKCVNGTYLVFGTSREAIRDNWYGKLRGASKLRGPAEEHPMIPSWEVFSEKFSGAGADRTIKEIVMRHPDDPNKPGHRICFAISGDPKTWRRLEGKDRVLGIYFDEVEGSRDLFTECFRRVLETNSHEEIKAEAGGGFISWSGTETKENEVFKEWMDKCANPEDYPEYRLFQLLPDETGAISNEERGKMAMNMSKEDYDIGMRGVGRYADRLLIYGRQLDPKRHLLEDDYEPQPEDNLWVVYDPGFDHNTGIVVAAIRPSKPNKLYIVRAWFHGKTTMGQDIGVLRQYLRGRFIECFISDPASHKTEKGSGKKLITQIREELVRAGIKSMRGFRMPYNRHAPGIYEVRRHLSPDPNNAEAEPLVVFNSSRESGVMEMWRQMCNYKSHKAGDLQGVHGVVKKNDEGPDCLVAGTMITTSRGDVPIEDVVVGDLAMTRDGWRSVTDAWCSSESSAVLEIETDDGRAIRGTPGHLVHNGTRYVRLDTLRPGDMISGCTSSTAEGSSGACAADTSRIAKVSCSIASSGPQRSAPSHRTITSTTETRTGRTTTSRIWNASACQTTSPGTRLSPVSWSGWDSSGRWQASGTDPRSVGRGTQNNFGKPGSAGRQSSASATNAELATKHGKMGAADSVQTHAKRRTAVHLAWTTSSGGVPIAAAPSRVTDTPRPPLALARVRRVTVMDGRERVFDLTVAGVHEFFANGILVHNCLRYLINCTDRSPWSGTTYATIMRPSWVKRPPNVPQWAGDAAPAHILPAATEVVLTEAEIIEKDRARKSALAAQIRSRGGKRIRRARFLESALDDD